MKILVIDDEPDLRRIFSLILERGLNATTLLAESKQNAIDILTSESGFNGIICDYHLPDGTAENILEYMKTHNLNIPVIICSGNSTEGLSTLKDYKVSGHLLKPFTTKEIIETVKNTFTVA